MPGTVVCNFDDPSDNRITNILKAIAQTKKMILVCGAGISTSSGIPDSRSPGGLHSQVIECGGTRFKCSELLRHHLKLEGERLAALNALMAGLRKTARDAPLGKFHQFIHRVLDKNPAAKCLTRNFDGLETRDRPDLAKRIQMVHGDNRVLRCSATKCAGVTGQDVIDIEEKLLSGMPVECPSCAPNETVRTRSRNSAGSKPLRPAVLLDEHIPVSLHVGKQADAILDAAGKCHLLLIAGTSLKSESMVNLVQELVTAVHKADGAVVLIDIAPINMRKWKTKIDFHLQVDIETCAERILAEMDANVEGNPPEIWHDLVNNVLPPQLITGQAPPEEIKCYLCMLAIKEFLIQCRDCEERFCTHFQGEEWGAPCIELDFFAEEGAKRTFEETKAAFLCPWCWNHSEMGVYPHFVRTELQFFTELEVDRPPRLLLVVFYLSEFWTVAEHLIGLVTACWASEGWSCFVEPIQLQRVDQKTKGLEGFTWEAGSFSAIVVYITHNMAANREFQIGDEKSCNPVEFFRRTLEPVRPALAIASSSHVFVNCCGHVFRSPKLTKVIQTWLNEEGWVNNIIGCLNTALVPAYMLNVVARASIELLGYRTWLNAGLLDVWLRDGLAATHTDIVCMTKLEAPVLWLFSPFQTRPLGKELPSLLMCCTCPGLLDMGEARSKPGQGQKIWKVTHDGYDGKPLRETRVRASCSLCKQVWILPTEHLHGHLRRIGGLYAAVVPYFIS